MLRRLGIRAKVLAVLAVPMIVLLIAGGYISYGAFRSAKTAAAAATVVEVLDAYAPLGANLQTERALSLALQKDQAQLDAARAATDETLAELKPVTARVDREEFPANVLEAFDESQRSHNDMLSSVRDQVDSDSQAAIIKLNYDKIISGQITLVSLISESMTDREVAAYIFAYHDLVTLAESLANELSQGVALIVTQASSPAAVKNFDSQTSATELARADARLSLEALGNPEIRLPSEDPTAEFTRKRNLLATGNAGSVTAVDPVAWSADIQAQLVSINETRVAMISEGKDVAAVAAAEERTAAIVTILISVLAAVLSFAFAIVVARGITVPLRRLTAAAGDVREQLPKLVEQMAVPGEGPGVELVQIPVESQDEVGRLAEAFNSVNATTLLVAQEQAALRGSIAEMFINVARRDQVLLNRQLSFIDSLERSEEDPNTLANLFRLDHLATRMRRNAESLLVLAGIDSGRRVRDAMPLSDVIRTASSEIEQYDRIELDLTVDPQMLGFNALSAAHLLAELFENATIFSEPETPVEVKTGVIGEFVIVQVLDHGLGMSDAELESANIKIRSTAASDSLGAQRLGLFVVGRIAHRLGAEVTLAKSGRGTGTITTVRFPITLFTTTESSSYGSMPQALEHAPERRIPVAEEAPVVEAVDLQALTDGSTSLGLPRRRLRGDEDSAEIPLPQVSGMPQRSTKTFDESKIVLPAAQATTLSPELSTETAGWSPAIPAAPARSGLPTRARAASSAWAQPEEEAPPAPVAPAAPEARVGLFSGFRTRGDLPAPAPADMPLAPHRAGPSAPANDFVVPGLAPDEDDATQAWDQGWQQPAVAAPAVVEPETEQWAPAAAWDSSPALAEPVAEEWAPAQNWDETPAAPEPVTEVWSPTPAWHDSAPLSGAPVHEEPAAVEETWEPTPAPEPPAPRRESAPATGAYPEFTAYSGYSGWATPVETDQPSPRYTSPYTQSSVASGFAPILDESRAWNAGDAEEAAPEPQAWNAPEPEAAPGWQQPEQTWQEPAAEWEQPAAQWQEPVVAAEPERAHGHSWEQPEPASQQEWSVPALEVEPAPSTWTAPEPVADAAPLTGGQRRERSSFYVDSHAPTEFFNPVEAEILAESHAQAEEPAPAPVHAPEPDRAFSATPAWATTRPAEPAPEGSPAFADLVQGDTGDDAKARRRWGLFGRKKGDEPLTPPHGTSASPFAGGFQPTTEPADAAGLRTSAWSDGPSTPLSEPTPVSSFGPPAPSPFPKRETTRPAGGWTTPETIAPERSSAAGAPPQPLSAFFRPPAGGAVPAPAPAASWAPPEWAARPSSGPVSAPEASRPVSPPSAAPRVGALDDEVAAMLALRSDIQEQALSELSQLSAYRPAAVNGSTGSASLTKRVPNAIPAAPPLAAAESDRATPRDADQLRSRLSSFQSGTSRGRRAAEDPVDAPATPPSSEPLIGSADQHSTPPSSQW
jgi:signal transduction histidine kinase